MRHPEYATCGPYARLRRVKSAVASIVLLVSCAAIAAAVYGVRSASQSPLFLVQVVEVTESAPVIEPPVSVQSIIDLAAVPVGKVSLFDLDLAAIEQRILSHSWIRSVRLVKSFPE